MESRRSILRGLAALPVTGLPAVATACAQAASPDPIFDAIEKHRAAEAAFQASFDQTEGDDAEALRSDLSEAEGDARTWMHDTVPQTVAGLAAYMAYWAEYTQCPDSLQLEEVGWEAIPTIAEAMAKLFPADVNGGAA